MDTILIQQLEAEAVIGVHAWEQRAPRPVVFDLELGFDGRAAAASDHLRDAVDYKSVADEVLRIARAQRFQLIETLAETISRQLFAAFPIATLQLTLSKPGAVPQARNIAVRIERRREDYVVCG